MTMYTKYISSWHFDVCNEKYQVRILLWTLTPGSGTLKWWGEMHVLDFIVGHYPTLPKCFWLNGNIKAIHMEQNNPIAIVNTIGKI